MTFDTQLVTVIIAAIIYIIDFIVRVWLIFYIPRNRKPTAAMAWLLLIFIIPLFGTILFFVLGSTKLSKKRQSDQLQINYMLKRYTTKLHESNLIANVKEPYDIRAKLAESLTMLPATTGNAVDIISGYDDLITEITLKLQKATHYIYIEFYILAMDRATEPFFEALEDAVKRGVKVKVLFDAYGSKKFPHYKAMQHRLTAAGVQWRRILPFTLKWGEYNRPDLRNHRKIVVIDNTDAYIGSLNMIGKTYNRKDSISYIELAAHLQGPSVNECAAVFASDWYAETGEFLKDFMENVQASPKGDKIVQIVPSGSNYPYENNLKLFTSLVQSARSSVTITNPYLVPDEALLGALISAAQRGVKVSILNSEAMDQWMVGHAQRSYYEELIRAGVQISLYKKPQLVHEKYMAIDDQVGIIGSSNLDIRSFVLNLECVAVAYDPETARELRKHHEAFLVHSRVIKLEAWRKRSFWKSFLDSVARLTSALQ